MTALTQHLHPLHEIADGALEGDNRIARRKVGRDSGAWLRFQRALRSSRLRERSDRLARGASRRASTPGPESSSRPLQRAAPPRPGRPPFGSRPLEQELTRLPLPRGEPWGVRSARASELVAAHSDLRHRAFRSKGGFGFEPAGGEEQLLPASSPWVEHVGFARIDSRAAGPRQ